MPQLLFEPAHSKVANDTYIVVPKNNSDTINVYEGEDDTDIRTGRYRFIAKCSEVVKDIIVGFYGNPTTVNGVLTGHSHSEQVVAALLVKYQNTFLPEIKTIDGKTKSVYVLEIDNNETYFDSQEEAFTGLVNWVKTQLQKHSIVEENVEEEE